MDYKKKAASQFHLVNLRGQCQWPCGRPYSFNIVLKHICVKNMSKTSLMAFYRAWASPADFVQLRRCKDDSADMHTFTTNFILVANYRFAPDITSNI